MGNFKEGSKAVGGGLGLVFLFLAIIALVGGVIWGFGVMTSGIKGQGDAVKINNSAENWTQKQGMFEDKYEGIKAYDRQITQFAEQIKADPKHQTARDNLIGIQAACIQEVGSYNAESKKFLSQDWKSIDLPAMITESDPTTDCK